MYYNDRGMTLPTELYNKLQWKLKGSNDGCRVEEEAGQEGVIEKFFPDFLVCVKALPKPAKVWTFHEESFKKFSHDITEEEDQFPTDDDPNASGYIQGCEGDSGGGHWMKGGATGDKNVLIGLNTIGSHTCGRFAIIEKLILRDILDWIKSHYNK